MFSTDSNNFSILYIMQINCQFFPDMKLVTNSNNINTLKLLISSNVGQTPLEMAYMAPAKVSQKTSISSTV